MNECCLFCVKKKQEKKRKRIREGGKEQNVKEEKRERGDGAEIRRRGDQLNIYVVRITPWELQD